VLIDLNRVSGLGTVTVDADGTLRIGAMTRNTGLERDPCARSHPIVSEALAEVAHPQIRNRGTIGGNLSQADPASEMPAVMQMLAARFTLRSLRGTRTVPAANFFVGPLATALAPDEMLMEIDIPRLPPGTGTAFLEFARRRGDYALMGVAAMVSLAPDGTCAGARLACCSAGPTPMLAPHTAAALAGTHLSDGDLAEASAMLRTEMEPLGGVQTSPAYQRHLAGVLATRALRMARDLAA
jgi:carbon-monoxide dehydrogenase medium subunit